MGDFDPQCLSDVLFEWAIKVIRNKLELIRAWHAKRLAGAEAARPSPLALDQMAFKPCARGRIWDLRGRKPVLLDTVSGTTVPVAFERRCARADARRLR